MISKGSRVRTQESEKERTTKDGRPPCADMGLCSSHSSGSRGCGANESASTWVVDLEEKEDETCRLVVEGEGSRGSESGGGRDGHEDA